MIPRPLERDETERYPAGEQIWVGDGVELVRARDARLDRAVAVKRMTGAPSVDEVARFVREAALQGQLEHPAVVPVIDLGLDRDGRAYLVLREVRGTALSEIRHGRDRRFPRRRLLAVMVDVCRAAAHAHSRNIVHGALRAEHILAGDFGETYLIEWGQASSITEGADPKVDVRALAALLAEIAGAAPPPELADAIAAAVAGTLDAAGLAAAIRRWLDGVRDLGRRRELAGRHRDRAAAALATRDTATAMREAGRALALDPQDAAAAQVLGRLVLTAPDPASPEAAEAVAASDATELRGQAKIAAWSFLAVPVFLPMLLWPGLKDPWVPLAIALLGGFEIALAIAASIGRLGQRWVWLSLAGNILLLALFSRVWGPLLAVPSMATTLSMTSMTVPTIRPGWLPAPLLALPVLGTWALEAVGLLPPTTWSDGTRMIVGSSVVALPPVPTLTVLALHAIAVTTVAAHYSWRMTFDNRDARRRLLSQAWHLEQIARV